MIQRGDQRRYDITHSLCGSVWVLAFDRIDDRLMGIQARLRQVFILQHGQSVHSNGVCIADGKVRIDGVPSAAVLSADRWGRPLPSWPQCRRLRPGELFLLSATNPASFDSRYFGPVSAAAVIGVARPVWLESRP